MRIALLTGTSMRHKYIAHQLAIVHDLVVVIAEEKSQAITSVEGLSAKDRNLLQQHFLEREQTEQSFFGAYAHFPESSSCIQVAHGHLHTDENIERLRLAELDVVALFGSSIVKEPILNLFPGRIINLHLGLSPYYRGSGTNFFPLLYGQPECLGATFHLATEKVDAGGILHQFRLQTISADETIHTLGNAIIQEAGRLYPRVLSEYLSGSLQARKPESQTKGKLFRVRDFTPKTLREVQQNLPKYLRDYRNAKSTRDILAPIINAFQ